MAKLAITLVLAGIAAFGAGCAGTSALGSGNAATPDPPPTGVPSLQRSFVSVVKAVSPTVVQIRTPQALGSGIVFDDRGDVVTNAHVVDGATQFIVTLASGASHPATLVGADNGNDIAVIRITGARPRPATFGNSSALQVGDIALAIGNPLGLRSSVTQGIVSAVGRSVEEGNGGAVLSSVIQTSAAINPGNSGGALVDLSGQVIGIPTLGAVDPEMGAEAPGIGFAIDSNTVRRIAGTLIRSHG